jgi:hypothetical protein
MSKASTAYCETSKKAHPRGCARRYSMEDFSALSDAERTLFEALNRHGVRYMLVGLSAAVLQGANTATRDIDIWFEDASDLRIGDAVREAKGIWVSGSFGMDGVPLPVLRLDRVIASKRAAGRKKDLAAIPALEDALAVLESQADRR